MAQRVWLKKAGEVVYGDVIKTTLGSLIDQARPKRVIGISAHYTQGDTLIRFTFEGNGTCELWSTDEVIVTESAPTGPNP